MTGPRIAGVRALYEGWGRYLLVEIETDTGERLAREVEDHGDAAAVLAFDPARRVAMLVKQLRAPMLLAGDIAETLECIAGRLEGDAPEACALREAHEEGGLRLSELRSVGAIQTMPGISTERIHCFLAPYQAGDRIGAGGGLDEESENITVVEMPLAELARLADAGELTDAKTLLLFQTLRLREPALFD